MNNVNEQIKREQATVVAALARVKKTVPGLYAKHKAAWARADKLRRASKDEVTPQEEAAAQDAQHASARVFAALDQVKALKVRLDLLNDPAEIERREIGVPRARRNGMASATEKKTAAPKNELTQEVIDRVVAEIASGKGIGKVADLLNTEGIAPPGRAKAWYAITVRAVYLKATGLTKMGDARSTAPLASRAPLKERAPAPVKVLDNAPAKRQAKPDPKPAAKKKRARR